MPIKAKYNITAESKDIKFGRTVIDWDRQVLIFQLSNSKNHNHDLTEGQWDYLTKGLQSLMSNIPNISDIEIPEFDPDLNQ